MVYTFPSAGYLLLLILCLACWPGTSPVPRLVAAYLVCLVIVLVHLPLYYCRRVYYRIRLYLIERELQWIERQMQELGIDPGE